MSWFNRLLASVQIGCWQIVYTIFDPIFGPIPEWGEGNGAWTPEELERYSH